MASHSYSTLGFSLLQELGSNEIIKKSRAYLVNPGGRKHDILPESSFNLKPQLLEPLKPFSSSSKSNHFVEFDSTMMKHRLMDVHETGPDPVCLSLGITGHYAKKQKVLEFLLSRSEELKEGGFDLSLLSELMGLEALGSSSQLPFATSSYFYLNQEFAKPLLDLMVDGNILFLSSRAELNDFVSTAAEFHRLRNSTRWRKLSRLVPQFQRFNSEALIDTLQLSAVKPDAVTLAPLKSAEKTRLKPSPKKQNPKIRDKEKDLYERNCLHAFESLISLMIGNEQHRKTTMLSLKKSRGELLELLTQCSIGFAGTGMAVLFFLVCDVASRQVPFCANKFFEGALSLSLVLLSWSVSRLREALVNFNRKTINEEEISNKVERRIKEVYFRAATVIAMVALRFG
ncbi:unnamed protein product [Arabidopsis lyrata]|uniref:Uncharacterized protein n=1 Tax=Arabidopsis lyrata subsp. lyrata TaxID=81972 RepID=D7KCE1_ARALL|nr:uncharacterized protein LOC9328219 isoform X1 [Arabidopsis lyrata subsp. lyrata]EFH65713.1 hypothetical protein ARALYDRAFT_887488 [Arabidopsis lyrata subsp. lyrata]CAH8251017.1 unnamed protein product [Arabidopsis lyrata]|eukprot:XP_002889454.1 uncharacterized protein LOC9328219 isoform X1 [Arabidopsis lyrata subsp. lyrata]